MLRRVSGIVVENLSKTFPSAHKGGVAHRALAQINFTVGPGEFLAVLGPSGAGKTTLLRLIAGLDAPDTGRVLLNGQPLDRIHPRERGLSMVFQDPALFPHLTARQNLELGLKLRRISRGEAARRIPQVAQRLHLEACLDRKPEDLSGGERQRVALGRAMLCQPSVLLLDEPFSNADPSLRIELRGLIREIQQELRATTILVTHDQDEALSLGARVAVLNGGRIEQLAPPQEIYELPANLFVAQFVGVPPINLYSGTLEAAGDALEFVAGNSDGQIRWPCPPQPIRVPRPVFLGLRAEHFSIEPGPGPALDGTVESIEYHGADSYVRFRCHGGDTVIRVAPSAARRLGSSIRARPILSEALLFDATTQERLGHRTTFRLDQAIAK